MGQKANVLRSFSFAVLAVRLAANEYSVLTRDVMSRLPELPGLSLT